MKKSNEEILFESFIRSAGYHFKKKRVYLPAYWPFNRPSSKYIATIDFEDPEIKVAGYGYPATVTTIAKQLESIFDKKVKITWAGDEPSCSPAIAYGY